MRRVFLILILFLISCEEPEAYQVSNQLPVNVKTIKIVPESMETVYRYYNLFTSTDTHLLGIKTYYSPANNPLYKIRIRPIYSFIYDSELYQAEKQDDQDSTLFTGVHSFSFKVDSLNNPVFNSGFNQKIKLKLLGDFINIQEMYSDNSNHFAQAKYSMFFEDNQKIHSLAESSEAIRNRTIGESSKDYSVNLSNDAVNKFYKRYDVSGQKKLITTQIILDYTEETEAMIHFSKMPKLILNRRSIIDSRDTVVTDTISASFVTQFLTYETLTNEANNILTSAGRANILVRFDANKFKNILDAKNVLASELSVKNDLDIFSRYISAFRVNAYQLNLDNRYNDGLSFDSLNIDFFSILNLDKNSNSGQYINQINETNSNRFYNRFLKIWNSNNGEKLEMMLSGGGSKYPSFNYFNEYVAADSSVVLIIYYLDKE